jgi:hypothetical protein
MITWIQVFQTQVPSGTSDNSPVIQRWVQRPLFPRPGGTAAGNLRIFSRPSGTNCLWSTFPPLKRWAIFLPSLRDEPAHCKNRQSNHTEDSFWKRL